MSRDGGGRLALPVGGSLALHAALAAAFLALRPPAAPQSPPSYRVSIVAAPAGPRAEGVVRPPSPDDAKAATAAPAAAAPAPAVERSAPPKVAPPPTPLPAKAVPAKAPPAHGAAPSKVAASATPAAPKATPAPGAAGAPGAKGAPKGAAAPRAAGGPVGGNGTDVATVRTEGIDFPYPWYLQNIVRQIALNFPHQRSALTAEVRFVVHRDGTVSDLAVVRRSGNFQFDFDARGAVEAASRRFGRLPDGFGDDALPVLFSFDPRVFQR